MNLTTGSFALTSTPPAPDDLTVVFAGDFCPVGRTDAAIVAGQATAMAAPLHAALAAQDLAIVNLEAPLTTVASPIAKTGPNLKGDPRAIEFLQAAGFDVANLANNHIRDHGDAAIHNTLAILERGQVAAVGAGLDATQAARPLFLERKGRRIGILAFAENEFSIAGPHHAGAAPLDPLINLGQIRAVAAVADVTIVLVHGGNEFCPVPNPRTMTNYRAFARAGASTVIATHTHCPQGVEVVDGVPIAYSLGNFLFDTPFTDRPYRADDQWWRGLLLQLDFHDNSVVRLRVVPVDSGPDGTVVRPLTGPARTDALAYLDHLSALLGDNDTSAQLWQAWCFEQGPWWHDYFRRVGTPEDLRKRADPANLMVLRNGFTCEAHYEVLKTYFSLRWDGVPAPTPAVLNRLHRLQKGRADA
jgi:poly-gamma-glutamate synthesis protein (capsule biosynthesis protein)